MAIWSILRPFGIVFGIWYIFSPFWYVVFKKFGNPAWVIFKTGERTLRFFRKNSAAKLGKLGRLVTETFST
jgi:hypothetical protein